MGKVLVRSTEETEWKEEDVGDKPFTVLCHQGDVRVKAKDQLEITPEYTTYHGSRVVRIHPLAVEWSEKILCRKLEKCVPSDRDISEAHVIGMCDLIIKLMDKGHTNFFVSKPETYLHPKQERVLADFFIEMAKKVPLVKQENMLPEEM